MLGRLSRPARDLAVRVAGGPARLRVVLLLAAVLGLNGADLGTVSATAGNLKQTFGMTNTQVGLLVSVVSLTTALGTIPIGVLTDRHRRTTLLACAVAIWSVALAFAGAAQSFQWLLLARVALGVATATTGPTVSSLVGDFFPANERSRMYGLILGGDLVGTGIGFMLSGEISSILPWPYAFWWLVPPGLWLAWLVRRTPEPARGGQSRLEPGAERIPDEQEADRAGPAPDAGRADEPELARRAVRKADIEPDPDLVLHTDPARRPIWWAIRYVLRVRTNVIMIVASALGYFFFAGLRSFAIVYVTGHYGLSKQVASVLTLVVGLGALAGVFASGRITDRLLRRGHARVRVVVPALCLLAIGPVLAPAIATSSVALALPLLVLGAALLGAPNPPMDAARLDIIHPRLWGRAEAVRTVLRSLAEAAAPTLFGYASQNLAAGTGTTGLEYAFLLSLIPLLGAGLLVLPALRTYPRDVATADASVQATVQAADTHPPARDTS